MLITTLEYSAPNQATCTCTMLALINLRLLSCEDKQQRGFQSGRIHAIMMGHSTHTITHESSLRLHLYTVNKLIIVPQSEGYNTPYMQ